MKRRQFIGLAAAGSGALCIPAVVKALTPRPSQACYEVHALKVRCVSGFAETPDMDPVSCPSLAWAGCLAYLLRGFGADVGLRDVLDRAGQPMLCAPGNDRSRLMAANGQWRDKRGRGFSLEVTPLPSLHETYLSDTVIHGVVERIARQPMLCGAAGHTTLITEISTEQGTMVGVKLKRVTVRDPVVASGGLRDLTLNERQHPFYVLGFHVSPL